ncbi:MAG: hydroxyethylthiazole kinase [Beijerinckiaceae bacterium]
MPLPDDVLELLARIGAAKPRIQCITNTVAQNLTANALLAIGADVSMAQHPAEIVAMSHSAAGLLINLGTLDLAREVAIGSLLEKPLPPGIPCVIDPVFADRSPLRFALACRLLKLEGVIIKGNAAEMLALAAFIPDHTTRVTTGAIDRVEQSKRSSTVAEGHPMMARVTATGCVAGAMIAAFAAVETDQVKAATAALTCFGMAGRLAAQRASGPGSFVPQLIDVLAECADSAAARYGQKS